MCCLRTRTGPHFLGMPSQEASMKCAVCEQERAHIFSGYALARGFHTCDKFLAAKLYNTDKNWNFDKKEKKRLYLPHLNTVQKM